MEKDDKELLKALTKLSDMLSEKENEGQREQIIKDATKNMQDFKKVYIQITENNCMMVGTGINLLCGLSAFVSSLRKKGFDKKVIEGAIETGYQYYEQEKEDNNKVDNLDNEKIDKVVEELSKLIGGLD